jgi:tetratricopeptide (TPR) repeat protein
MPTEERIEEFPRDAYLKLLQGAQRLFSSEQERRNLLAGLGLSSVAAERQRGTAVLPPSGSPARDDRSTAREQPENVPEALSSPASFAAELVELVARPSSLDAAITLARRAVAEAGDAAGRWDGLLHDLAALQRKYRIERGPAPDIAGYREWMGFDCRHPYSLTDRFIGRQNFLKELDDWITNGKDVAVRCIWALGGGGKSALAWHWVTKSLPLMRRLKYQGAFWCSFYEKSFGFEEFVRRALAFGGQLNRADVDRMPREVAEERLLDVIEQRRLILVLDGLERLMNGYAIVADRAVDLESLKGTMRSSGLSRIDRRMADQRDAAFIRRLARAQASRIVIATRLVPADLESIETSSPLSHVVFTQLPGLGEAEAVELWQGILPSGSVSRPLRELFQTCGYHPLVISVLARAVARCKGGWMEWLQAHGDFHPERNATTEAAIRTYIVGVCLRDLPEPEYQVLGTLTATGKPMQLKDLADVLLLGSRTSGDGRWLREEQVGEHLQRLIELGLVGEARPPDLPAEYDVHPVVRGAAWELLTDPTRERVISHNTEFWATPDRRGPSELDDLDKAIGHYKRLVQTGQLDRAWEMFVKWFWVPFFFRHSAYRQLLGLIGFLLPGREVLQLLPLSSRLAQAEAAGILGDLLAKAGEGYQAKTLLRWAGTIRLQIGDLNGFLDAAHTRAWQTMYEGRLFETERALRELKLQALAFGAHELRPILECWIGIILALRGEQERAETCFERARGRTPSNNWWVQGLAEGLVYLEQAGEALDMLDLLQKGTSADDEPLQVAWEKLTEGMAFMGTGNFQKAEAALAAAYTDARKANYKIIQCFALPSLAEIALRTSRLEEAEEWLKGYAELDPEDEYALSAADAWRVRSSCQLKRQNERSALECAERAFRLAACDGPPFVYKAGLRRALDALRDASGYVPATDARLEPRWREDLVLLDLEEGRLEHALAGPPEIGEEEIDFDEAAPAPQPNEVLREASLLDREWWDEMTGSHPDIQARLMAHMWLSHISLPAFRKAFEADPHQSLLTVFHRLRAERVIHPDAPRPLREQSPARIEEWLADAPAQKRAFDAFLASPEAARMAQPFRVHAFVDEDIAAFLSDCKRRIEFDADPVAEAWWTTLEQSQPGLHMLVLAEFVLAMPARLAEVVQEISLGSDHGITYAFYSLLMRRSLARFESNEISKTEGWSDVDVLLRLQDVKLQIDWRESSPEVKQFWDKLERDNQHHLRQVLQLAEELRRRGASATKYYEAHVASNSGNIQANLAYLDYTRHREQRWEATASWPIDAAAERWVWGVRPSFTDAGKLSPDQLSGRLEVLLNTLGRKDLAGDQEAWWKGVETATAPAMRLRLAEELDFRRETLAGLRRAIVDGDTDNLVAAIAYLDFKLLNRGEEHRSAERALEHNRAGNAHYKENRFRDAVACYELAILERATPVHFTNLAGACERIPDLDSAAALDQAIATLRRGLERFQDSEDLRKALRAAERKKRTIERGGLVQRARSHQMLPVVTPVAIEFAANLAPIFETAGASDVSAILQRVPEMRERIQADMGIKVPGLRLRRNDSEMPDGTYLIMLSEIPLVMATVRTDQVLTFVPEARLSELGIEFKEADPVDDRPAFWIARSDAARHSVPSGDAVEYVVRHLESVIRKNLPLFAGLQEVVDKLNETWSPAGRQIASDDSHIERFTRMTHALLDEGVPMSHMEPICDAYLAGCAAGFGMDELLGAVRALAEIRPRLPGNQAGATMFELDPVIEAGLVQGLAPIGDEFVLALKPEYTQEVLSAVRVVVPSRRYASGQQAIVVRERRLRRYVRRLVELEFPHLFTLCPSELSEDASRASRTTIARE